MNVIYCAYGLPEGILGKYLPQIEISMASVRKRNKGVSFYIMTDNKCVSQTSDYKVRSLTTGIPDLDNFPNTPFYGKLKSLICAPRGKNLFLGGDTICLTKFEEDFPLFLDKYDFIGTPNQNPRVRRKKFKFRQEAMKDIPFHFTPVQGDVWAWNSEPEKNFEIFTRCVRAHREWGKRDDQITLTKMLWEEDLKFLMLPGAYNFVDPIMGYAYLARGAVGFYHYAAMKSPQKRAGIFKGPLGKLRKELHDQIMTSFSLPKPKSNFLYCE